MPDRARVLVVGSSNTDMVVKVPRIPPPGETVTGGSFIVAAGGKGANQAVAAARLGAEVCFVARLGADSPGDAALTAFDAEGIQIHRITRDPAVASGVALIIVEDSGQNAIAVAPGANMSLSPADIDSALPELLAADIVVAQCECPMGTVIHLARLCAANRKPFLLNPAPAVPLPPEVLESTTILTPNEFEAAVILGEEHVGRPLDPEPAAEALRARGARTVVITLGSEGCAVAHGGRTWRVPARRAAAVDATAAGDCFTGALAVALAEGRDVGEAVAFATAAAAISVTRLGAQPSLPRRSEVDGQASQ